MTTNKLRELFFNNKDNDKHLTISDVLDTMRDVKGQTEMDDNGDYYYKINLLELSNSNIEDNTIYKMVDDGWKLSKDRASIIKKC